MTRQTPAVEDPAAAIERVAVGLLARREHSRTELTRKLCARGYDQGAVDLVLDDLQRRRLLSDERFTEAYVAERCRKGFGPLRIRAELAERGIDAETARRWLEPYDDDWARLLGEAALRHFGGGTATERRDFDRRGRFLEQRGFPISLIRRYLDALHRAG